MPEPTTPAAPVPPAPAAPAPVSPAPVAPAPTAAAPAPVKPDPMAAFTRGFMPRPSQPVAPVAPRPAAAPAPVAPQQPAAAPVQQRDPAAEMQQQKQQLDQASTYRMGAAQKWLDERWNGIQSGDKVAHAGLAPQMRAWAQQNKLTPDEYDQLQADFAGRMTNQYGGLVDSIGAKFLAPKDLIAKYNERLAGEVKTKAQEAQDHVDKLLAAPGQDGKPQGLWGVLKNNPGLAALPIGLAMTILGSGKTTKILGMLAAAFGAYSLKGVYQDLNGPAFKGALEATGKGQDWKTSPEVAELAKQQAAESGRTVDQVMKGIESSIPLAGQLQQMGVIDIHKQIQDRAAQMGHDLQLGDLQPSQPVAPPQNGT